MPHDIISDVTSMFHIMDQVTGKRYDFPIRKIFLSESNGQKRALGPSNKSHNNPFGKTVMLL